MTGATGQTGSTGFTGATGFTGPSNRHCACLHPSPNTDPVLGCALQCHQNSAASALHTPKMEPRMGMCLW